MGTDWEGSGGLVTLIWAGLTVWALIVLAWLAVVRLRRHR